jgi:hypothetical protein
VIEITLIWRILPSEGISRPTVHTNEDALWAGAFTYPHFGYLTIEGIFLIFQDRDNQHGWYIFFDYIRSLF